MHRFILVNKKWTALSIFCGCCGITLFIFAFVLPMILLSLIKQLAAEQAVMTNANYDLWGQVPGGTKTDLFRDFTFYDFKNPYDVMFRNSTPIFVEKGPYSTIHNNIQGYQELQDFRDFNFTDDGDVVEFNFDVRTEGNQEGRVTFANFIAIGAWHQMKNTESPSLFLQAFSAFYFELKKFIYVTMQSQAIRPSLLTEKDIPTLLGSLTPQQQQLVWNDQEFGMKNVTSFINWVVAVRDGVHSNSTQFLKEYFVLTYEQMSSIIINLESKYIKAAKNILSNLFCDGKDCKDTYLCAKQWATQGITNEPASGSATPSVITGNSTASGYPEISYFYTEYFLKKIDNSKEYQNLKFDITWAEKVLNHYENYSLEDPKYYTDQHLLLHIGNIRYLYQIGEQYDQTKNKSFLEQIKARFLTPSVQHARVFWEYCKYFEKEFAVQTQNNGTVELAALGTVASQSLYGEMMVLQNNLVNYLLIDLIALDLPDCHSVISIIGNQTQTEKFCSRKEYEKWDKQSISKLIYLCNYKSGDYWKQILKEIGYKEYQLDQLCDDEEEIFGLQLEKAHQILKSQYDCAQQHCNNYELTHKQWAYSAISLNPPKNIFQPKTTLANIYPSFRAIEYSYFKDRFSDVIKDQQLDQKQLRYLLSFDCLYNGQMIQNAFIYLKNNNLKEYKNWFIFDDFSFLHYIRYIMVEIGFDGFADTRTVQEILFGYMPTIVKAIKEMNPAMGGDPSSPAAGLNINPPMQKQSMHTGKKDVNMVRQFVNIDGLPYLTVRVPYFDGNNTQTKLVNPWLIEEPCSLGTDALSYAPNQQKGGKVSTVITDLIRGADLIYDSEVDVFGLNAYQYNVDPKFLDKNESYHNFKFNGLLNFTTAQNAPIFNSGRHFYLGDSEKLQSFIKVYKYDNLTAEQRANKWDNSYVVVEPLSGVVLQATLNLQVNVEYKQDILFPCDNYAILPILSIHRAGNWSKSSVDEIFGDLKTGLKFRTIIFWLFIFLGPICIILTGVICWYKRKPYITVSTDLLNNDLQQSLQNEENLNQESQNQINQNINIIQGSDVQN